MPTIGGLGTDLIYEGNRQGLFDPSGSVLFRELLRRHALRGARNRRQRTMGASRLYGLSPYEERRALVNVDRENSGDIADFLNEAQFNEQAGSRDFIRRLLTGQLDFEHSKELAKYQQDLQGGGAGSIFGGILGTGIGAFTGGVGDEYARKLFR